MALRSSKKRSDEATPGPRQPQVDSLISEGMVLRGDCETPGTLRVDGQVTGSVRASRLVVGPTGRVGGDVSGPNGAPAERDVIIEGRVEGTVRAPRVQVGEGGAVGGGMHVDEAVIRGRVSGGIASKERLLLEETAVVEGDVVARRLGLKEGGQVFGTIRIGDRPAERPRGG